MVGISSTQAVAGSVEEANKKLVSDAMHELFVTRDAEKAVRLYFGSPYLQHNPMIPDGAEDLPKIVASLPANFKYEPGIIVAGRRVRDDSRDLHRLGSEAAGHRRHFPRQER